MKHSIHHSNVILHMEFFFLTVNLVYHIFKQLVLNLTSLLHACHFIGLLFFRLLVGTLNLYLFLGDGMVKFAIAHLLLYWLLHIVWSFSFCSIHVAPHKSSFSTFCLIWSPTHHHHRLLYIIRSKSHDTPFLITIMITQHS